jgi:hypothetical protein
MRQARGCGCHDLPRFVPTDASFAAPNTCMVESPAKGVGSMLVHHNWLPQLFNWLAVLVLLSLGVLL